MHQYLEAQREATAKIKRGWRVAKLAKNLERHFKTGDKIIRMILRKQDGQPFYALLYTPVTSSLRKMAERLGDFMHAPSARHAPDDPWWQETREFLESVWLELEKATRGNLLGVPLRNERTGSMNMVTEPLPGESLDEHGNAIGSVGSIFIAQVEYLDEFPESREAK